MTVYFQSFFEASLGSDSMFWKIGFTAVADTLAHQKSFQSLYSGFILGETVGFRINLISHAAIGIGKKQKYSLKSVVLAWLVDLACPAVNIYGQNSDVSI